MENSEHYRKLENMMYSGPFIKLTGIKALVKKGEAQMTLPVKQDFYHAAGAMHGALYFLALDNAAYFAVNSLVEDVFVLSGVKKREKTILIKGVSTDIVSQRLQESLDGL